MIQPGRETNIPTSSGSAKGSLSSTSPILRFNGFTLTMGMVLIAVLFLLLYQTFYSRRRRR